MRWASGCDRSRPTLRLLRLSSSNGGLDPSPPNDEINPRNGSLFDGPWDESGRAHHFDLRLLDGDGQPVTPIGADAPVAVGGDFEVGRPPGLREGSMLRMPFAISFGPVALPAGQRFVWQLEVDG